MAEKPIDSLSVSETDQQMINDTPEIGQDPKYVSEDAATSCTVVSTADSELEDTIQPQAATDAPVTKEVFEFFWKTASPFSQWYDCQFDVDGTVYKCAEQFMMHQKAVMFADDERANAILKASSPRKQKSLGRKVDNFDQKLWDEQCLEIVKRGNKAKFSQDLDLKKILFATYPKILVEASPCDTIWGIGLAADDRRARKREQWRGKNLLGFALTDVRNELMKEEGIIESISVNYTTTHDSLPDTEMGEDASVLKLGSPSAATRNEDDSEYQETRHTDGNLPENPDVQTRRKDKDHREKQKGHRKKGRKSLDS